QSIAATGITNASTAASQLLLVFNTNQTGPHTLQGEAITLDALGLAIWNGNTLVWSTLTTLSDVYDTTLQGVGQAGFGYKLDAAQAAAAQTAINTAIAGGASLNSLMVTGAFQAGCLSPATTSCANGGPETVFLDSQAAVPEPMSLSLVGGGLLALGLFRKRFSA
ncbi:MAG TPA: PEP-CTERM sorting domain-containing protein, partial [Bryobacteraceae bacterium]|nr:PEP-CTERM sorting domain-containing protein [Bryobacteraceae bacterium]